MSVPGIAVSPPVMRLQSQQLEVSLSGVAAHRRPVVTVGPPWRGFLLRKVLTLRSLLTVKAETTEMLLPKSKPFSMTFKCRLSVRENLLEDRC